MKAIVCARPCVEFVALQRGFHFGVDVLQRRDDRAAVLRAHGGDQFSGHALEGDDHVIDLAHIVRRQRQNGNAAFGQNPHQAFFLKPDQRLMNGGPAHAEPERDFLLRALVTGREGVVANGVLQRLIGVGDKRGCLGKRLCGGRFEATHVRSWLQVPYSG